MKPRTPKRAAKSPSNRWIGVRGVVCALLFVLASIQEASHNHGLHVVRLADGVHATNSVTFQAAADDTDCPLCAAMHGASLASAQALVVTQKIEPEAVVQFASGESSTVYAFALFSRPPPSLHYS